MAGGTGNLILKRGTTIPQDGQNSGTTQLLKAMPATQLVGLSHVVNDAGTLTDQLVYAYENYPNRLWIGMDSFGTSGQESGTGQGTGTAPGAGVGQMGGGAFNAQNQSGAATRPIWFGAEIRADAAVYTSTGGTPDTVPTILQADWTNPSDYVLVTQKSIKSYVETTVAGKGSMSSFTVTADVGSPTTIINADTLTLTGGIGVDTSVNGDAVTFTLDLTELTTEASPAVGDFLSGVDISLSNVTRNFTIGTALGVLGGDISVNTGTGSATVSATNVKAAASTDSSTFLAILDNASATAQPVKYHTGLTYDTTTGSLTVTGDLAVNGGDITTTAGTVTVFNSNATTLNLGGAATTVSLGAATGTTTINNANTVVTGDLAVNGGDITTTAGTVSLFDSTATTVNIAGAAATALNLGFDGTGGSNTNISVGELTSASHFKYVNIGTTSATTNQGFVQINIGSIHALSSLTTVNGNLVVTGNLTIDGTTTTVNTTTLLVEDKNIELGNVTTPTDITANNGGITLLGDTNKTLLWNGTTLGGVPGVWRSSENFSIASGKSYAVADDVVLTKTYLKLYNAGNGAGSIAIKSPSSGSDIGTQLYTLPLTLGAANQVLTVSTVSSGDATLLWVDPSSLSTGAASSVIVRSETTTNNTTKYPIPFLGSSSVNSPASTWTGLADGGTATAYLLTDATSTTLASTPTSPTNSSTGLFYEVSDGSSAIGTLYCDYIGATLDCGTYA